MKLTWHTSPNDHSGYSANGKPFYIDRYLFANSYYHLAKKVSVVNVLVYRAVSISPHDNFQVELNHIQQTLQNNVYTKGHPAYNKTSS